MPRFFVVMITLCGCVGCDQVSKSAARTLLASGVTESLFADSLRLQTRANPGAFLSLGGSLPEQLRFTLFTAAAAVLLDSAWCAHRSFARRPQAGASYSPGAGCRRGISNLLDRLFSTAVLRLPNVGIRIVFAPFSTGRYGHTGRALLLNLKAIRIAAGCTTSHRRRLTVKPCRRIRSVRMLTRYTAWANSLAVRNAWRTAEAE